RLPATDPAAPMLTIAPADLEAARVPDELLMQIWAIVRTIPFCLAVVDGGASPERLAAFAQRVGARLRVHKLVVIDPGGGVHGVGSAAPLSFMDEAVAEQLLHAGEAESVGLASRRPLLDAIRQGLVGGIASVNLCTLEGLARELFTYEGSGTLFTR